MLSIANNLYREKRRSLGNSRESSTIYAMILSMDPWARTGHRSPSREKSVGRTSKGVYYIVRSRKEGLFYAATVLSRAYCTSFGLTLIGGF